MVDVMAGWDGAVDECSHDAMDVLAPVLRVPTRRLASGPDPAPVLILNTSHVAGSETNRRKDLRSVHAGKITPT